MTAPARNLRLDTRHPRFLTHGLAGEKSNPKSGALCTVSIAAEAAEFSRPALVSALVLAMVALAPPREAASEKQVLDPVVALHPLVRIERDATSDTWHVRALGPLIEWGRTPRRSWFLLRPLVRVERDSQSGERQFDLLWPLIRRAWRARSPGGPADLEMRILPFFRLSHYTSPAGEERKSLVLFPFVYWGRQGASGRYLIVFPFYWTASNARLSLPIVWRSRRSFDALVPLYGRFDDLWGNDEVRFYGWPFLIRSRKGGERATSLVWPFVRWARSRPPDDGWAARLWPLGGVRARRGRLTEAFFLWPLGHLVRGENESEYQLMLLPLLWKMQAGRTRLSYYFPLLGRYESPLRKTTSYLWPLYAHSVGRKEAFDDHRLLWFVFRWRRGPQTRITQFWPLGGRTVEPDRYSGFALWPLLRAEVKREPRSQVETKSSLPFYWFRRRRWNDGSEQATWTLAPFGRYDKARDRTRRLRLLWPIWIAESEPVETIYAPLWTFYDRRTVPGEFLHREIFGKTWLLHRDSDGQTREINLPLVSWRRTRDLDRLLLLGALGLEAERLGARSHR